MDGGASTCSSCGREVHALANWCSVCGADLRSSVLVLDDEAGDPAPEVVVEVESQPVRWRIIGGVLLVAATIIGVASFTGGSDDPADDEVAAEEEPSTPDEADTSNSTGSLDDDPPVDIDEAEAQQGGDEPDPAVAATGPLVGEDTGFDLLITTERRTLSVDLDAGVVEEFDGTATPFHSGFGRAQGVVVIGDRLVTLARDPSPSLQVRPIDDLDAEPRAIDIPVEFDGQLDIAASSTPGRVWILSQLHSDDRQTFEVAEIDLDSDRVIASREIVSIWFFPPILGPDGAVIWTPEGTRLVTPEAIEPWPHGQSLVFGPGVALSMVCDDDLDCFTGFVDLETGEVTRLPDGAGPWFGPGPGTFSADGAVYATFDWNRGSVRVIHVGSAVDVQQFAVSQNGDEVNPAISPDGRYVAWLRNRSLHVGIVETGEVITVDRELTGPLSDPWSASMTFIPSAD